MVSLAGLPPANRAGLDCNEAQMILVARAARFHQRKATRIVVRAGLAVLNVPLCSLDRCRRVSIRNRRLRLGFELESVRRASEGNAPQITQVTSETGEVYHQVYISRTVSEVRCARWGWASK